MHYYQNALQTPTLNAGLTRRLYGVHAARPQRTHGALEDPTALPQRCHRVSTALPQRVRQHAVETPSRGVCFEHAESKRRRMAS